MYRDIISCLASKSNESPEKVIYSFLENGDLDSSIPITFKELHDSACRIAAQLQAKGAINERVLLLVRPGPEFIFSLFGCFYAGAIAVPLYPPLNQRDNQRIIDIANDCKAKFAIVRESDSAIRFLKNELQNIEYLDFSILNNIDVHNSFSRSNDLNKIALLQYTSGSTGSPKGVKITHNNLAYNVDQIGSLIHYQPGAGVVWLPPFHDMGLIGGIIYPVFMDFHMVLMPPFAFVQNPKRWLIAITEFKALASAAPNFALRFCVEKIPPEERVGIDLSSLKFLFCGAEPLHSQTVELFQKTYHPYGFGNNAIQPCYGLAEATLLVTGNVIDSPIKYLYLDSSALNEGKVKCVDSTNPNSRCFISCGKPVSGTEVLIIKPNTNHSVLQDEIGEIWLHGQGITSGYWGKEKDENYRGYLYAGNPNEYLKTGDIGFLYNNELFIVGRIKDTIIVRGRNLYSQDIEQIAAEKINYLSPSKIAAFSYNDGYEEGIGILIELTTEEWVSGKNELFNKVNANIKRTYNIGPLYIAVVRRGLIPRTTSGKIKRFACNYLISHKNFKPIAVWNIDG